MSFLERLQVRFRNKKIKGTVDDELRFHMEKEVEQNLARGMSPDEARRQALSAFGGVQQTRENVRQVRWTHFFEVLLQDLRYALRILRKSPGFTAVALLIMTLGIGANTAIFSLTHAVLLRSLPVSKPGELVLFTFSKPGQSLGVSGPMFHAIEKRQQVYRSLLAWRGTEFALRENGETRQIQGALASGEAFATLGVQPFLGRLIATQDDQTGGGSGGWAAVISYDFWKEHFHGDRNVIGRALEIEKIPVIIVGVAPAGFSGVEVGAMPQVILPLKFEIQWHGEKAMLNMQGGMFLTLMGRLRPDVTLAHAAADLERIKPEVFKEADSSHMVQRFFPGMKLAVEPGRAGRSWLRLQYREPLLVLQSLVALVLLICCSNLTMLLLARASGRRREIAIRSALGAHRWRLVRQLLIESLMISVAGGALGLWLAGGAGQVLLGLLTAHNQYLLDLHPDIDVLVFTSCVVIATALFSGLLPGLRATRVDIVADIKEGAAAAQGGRQRGAEPWLLAGQVGFSTTLVIVAGLFAGTLYRLLSMNPGFRTDGVLVIPADFTSLAQKDKDLADVYARIFGRLDSMPGIEGASVEEMSPLTGWQSSMALATVGSNEESGRAATVFYNAVGPSYFATRGTRVLVGRDVSARDTSAGHKVCFVNASAARYFFGNEEAVGKTLRDNSPRNSAPATYEVAGVVEDAKYTTLRAPAPPTVYFPFLQFHQASPQTTHFVLHVNNVAAAIASYRQVVHTFVPNAPFLQPITMREQVRTSIGRDLTMGMLSAFFAVVALLLTAVGLYGVLAFSVARRTPEIGIRMALGARPGHVVWDVSRQAVVPVLSGLVAGAGGAVTVGRLIDSLLYGTRASDPTVYIAGAALMVIVGVLAAWVPARRATGVDPLVALRYE